MQIDEIEELRKNPELRAKIEQFGVIKQIKQDDVILREDSYINSIPILLSGALKVTRKDADGKEFLIYYIKPGESCVMSLLGSMYSEKSHIQAIAEEDSELLVIPISASSEWIKEFPEWTTYFFRIFQKRFEELLQVVDSVAFQKMDTRIFNFLVKKSEINNNKTIQITHQQIADELGTVREVVSRILKQLERENQIKLARNNITLL